MNAAAAVFHRDFFAGWINVRREFCFKQNSIQCGVRRCYCQRITDLGSSVVVNQFGGLSLVISVLRVRESKALQDSTDVGEGGLVVRRRDLLVLRGFGLDHLAAYRSRGDWSLGRGWCR